jgi:hypothetical protein
MGIVVLVDDECALGGHVTRPGVSGGSPPPFTHRPILFAAAELPAERELTARPRPACVVASAVRLTSSDF